MNRLAGRTGGSRRLRGAALALLLALPLAACSPMDDFLVSIFGRSMRHQPAFEPYEHPMPPPEGSVPFAGGNLPAARDQVNLGEPEGVPLPPPFTPGDVARQADVVVNLENPVPADSASLARGQVLYNRFCSPCHSQEGIGSQAPLAEVHPTVAVYNLSGDVVRGYTDGYIYGMIRVGRGLMPAYGHRVSNFDRWNIVNYVRRLEGVVPEGGVADSAQAGAQDAPAGDGEE